MKWITFFFLLVGSLSLFAQDSTAIRQLALELYKSETVSEIYNDSTFDINEWTERYFFFKEFGLDQRPFYQHTGMEMHDSMKMMAKTQPLFLIFDQQIEHLDLDSLLELESRLLAGTLSIPALEVALDLLSPDTTTLISAGVIKPANNYLDGIDISIQKELGQTGLTINGYPVQQGLTVNVPSTSTNYTADFGGAYPKRNVQVFFKEEIEDYQNSRTIEQEIAMMTSPCFQTYWQNVTTPISLPCQNCPVPGQMTGPLRVLLGSDGILDRVIIISDGMDFSGSRDANFVIDKYGINNLNEFRNYGIDIVIVDWPDPMGYIQNNAAYLTEAIRQLSQEPDFESIIAYIGTSMGGLIGRYTLLEMEDGGEPHHVELCVTVDSPHKGANIPVGLQAAVKYGLHFSPNDHTLIEMNDILENPAPQQMLLYTILDWPNFQASKSASKEYGIGPSSLHTQLYGYLGTRYPSDCKNIAIADGNSDGTLSQTPGIEFFNVNSSGVRRVVFDVPGHGSTTAEINAFNWSGDAHGFLLNTEGITTWNQNFYNHVSVRTPIFNIQWRDIYHRARPDEDTDNIDCVPGSIFNLKDVSLGGVNILENWSFTPTTSALGMGTNWLQVPSPTNVPFDDYFVNNDVDQHSSITPEKILWLRDQITNLPSDPLNDCNFQLCTESVLEIVDGGDSYKLMDNRIHHVLKTELNIDDISGPFSAVQSIGTPSLTHPSYYVIDVWNFASNKFSFELLLTQTGRDALEADLEAIIASGSGLDRMIHHVRMDVPVNWTDCTGQSFQDIVKVIVRVEYGLHYDDFEPPFKRKNEASYSISDNIAEITFMDGSDILIRPNPAYSSIEIVSIEHPVFDIEIYDLNGQIALFKKNVGSEESLSVSHLSSGTYFMVIKAGEDSVVKKLIKHE